MVLLNGFQLMVSLNYVLDGYLQCEDFADRSQINVFVTIYNSTSMPLARLLFRTQKDRMANFNLFLSN